VALAETARNVSPYGRKLKYIQPTGNKSGSKAAVHILTFPSRKRRAEGESKNNNFVQTSRSRNRNQIRNAVRKPGASGRVAFQSPGSTSPLDRLT
jgi:hypothetical protein